MGTLSLSTYRTFLQYAILLLGIFFTFASYASASTSVGTIDSVHAYAWSNNDGWINFGTTNGGLQITDTAVTGYAWDSNTGWINMAPSQGGVTNDGEGHLGGFAWGAGTGWINFTGVTIGVNGRFQGTAAGVGNGSNIGTITFDCTNCWVQTDWRSVTWRSAPVTGGGGSPSSGGSTGGSSGGGVATSTSPTSSLSVSVATLGALYTNNPASIFNPKTSPTHAEPTTPPPATHTIIKTGGQSTSTASVSDSFNAGKNCILVTNDLLTLKTTECGILEQILPGIGMVKLEVQPGSSNVPTVFRITVQTAHQTPGQPPVGDVYDISAYNAITNAPIHKFSKLLKITLPVPTSFRGKQGLHLKTRETTVDPWSGIPNSVFAYDTVTFYVDHLSMFTITADENTDTTQTLAPVAAQTTQNNCVLIPAIDAYLTFYVQMFGCTILPLEAIAGFLVLCILIVIAIIFIKTRKPKINSNLPTGMPTGQSF